MKHLRLLLALFTLMIGGASASAQTDVTNTYITNADFEGSYTTPYHPNGDRDISQPNGWTLTYTDGVSYDSSILKETQNTYSNISGQGLTIPGDDRGDQTYAVRFHNNGNKQLITLAQGAQVLPAGYYTISGLFWTQNQNELEVGFYLGDYSNETRVKYGAGNKAWKTLSYDFESDGVSETIIGLFFKHTAGNQTVAGVDNIKLTYSAFVDPTAITLSETSLSMIPTATKTLSVASYTPTDANHNTAITWTSSDESVATVADGVVTAVAVGTATINATTANNVTTTCTVTVNEAPLANGDYYILNVSKNKYLGGANSWGSQASVINHGIPFYAELANGVYKLNSKTYNSDTDHFVGLNSNGDLFMDNAGTGLYITSLGSGKFSISTSDGADFLTASNDNTIVSKSATDASSELAQWKFITKDELEAALTNATSANPVDATFYIGDPNFSRNYWPAGYNVSSWTMEASNKNLKGGNNENMCAESYHSTFTLSQVLTVPNGQYKLRAQACENVSLPVAVVYANDETTAFKAMANNEGSMGACSTQFSAGNYYTDWITVNVTDNTLTVGAKSTSSANWCVWDNFELCYLGPTIGGEAIEKTDPMEADKWYYFDIAVDGDYNLTATTLSDIVYTADGTILIENESTVTNTFGENPITLVAGRYYVKSASEQTFEYTPDSYDYEVGQATLSVADGDYTQSNTFTVTFPDAATNDPEATAALVASSKATVNGTEVALSTVTNGISLDLGTLTPATDYVISIPAGVYGYAAGDIYNEAISLTIHTPAVFDGTYFIRTSDGKYISRGGNYNTRAIIDEFGLPLALTTNASGVSEIKFVDSNQYFFDANNGTIYTDNTIYRNWTIQAITSGYYIINANDRGHNGEKVGIDTGNNVMTNNQDCVWTFEPLSEHNTHMEALKDAQAATAATAAGLSSITTKADLATELDNYNYESVTVDPVSFTEKWNDNATADNSYSGNGVDFYSKTVENLPAGLYKLTVKAYYRLNSSAMAAEGARGNVYLFGGSAKTQLYAVHDFSAQTPWVNGNDQQDSNGYYPNNATGGTAALSADGYYLNELYVYHEGGNFTYGIHQPNRFTNSQWCGFQNFTLTRYIVSETVTIKKGFIGTTYSSEYPLDFSSTDGISAYIITDAKDGKCTIQEVEKVPARTGLYIEVDSKEANEEQNVDYKVKVYSGNQFDNVDFEGNFLHGTVNESVTLPLEQPATYYLHGKQNGKESFYRVASQYEAKPNKAYLAIPGTNGAKALVIVRPNEDIVSDDGGFADGINNVEQADSNAKIYNLNGQRVKDAKKGIYIKNGKKVIIK